MMAVMKTRPSSPRLVRHSLALAALAALGLTACGGAEEAVTERVLEEAAGEGVDVEVGDDGEIVAIETEDGSMEVGIGGDLPEEWPAEVPTFDGTITGNQVFTSNGETIVIVSYSTDQTPTDVVDAMRAEIEAAGFTVVANNDMTDGAGAGLSSVIAEKDNLSVTFTATGSPDEATAVQASVVIKPA